ncbi:MAG: hypothetical protein LBM93_04485 [Oscillospiraceae bacterium]|jgi:transposase|nr:hypothetical protein [Oscillospiraceae bacterium]
MEKQIYISQLSQYEGQSLREISKRTGYHFNTVKKYADCENWNKGYKARKEKVSGIEPLKPTIDKWISEDLRRERKYSHSILME